MNDHHGRASDSVVDDKHLSQHQKRKRLRLFANFEAKDRLARTQPIVMAERAGWRWTNAGDSLVDDLIHSRHALRVSRLRFQHQRIRVLVIPFAPRSQQKGIES